MTELEQLNQEILKCNKCKLNKLRGFGFGNINSKIMFIAQNPGIQTPNSTTKSEDIVPFALNTPKGVASGAFFRKLLDELGIKNEDFYITNIIKCPREDSNDPPTPLERDNCRPFLNVEIELQNPELIIGLGNPTRELFKLEKYGDIKETPDGLTIISVYHPGYISRSPNEFGKWKQQFSKIESKLKKILNEKVVSEPEKKEVQETKEPEEQRVCEPFVHLHMHDEYSLLDGFSKVEDYAEEAKKRGWKYLAVTNHGLMGQIPRQYKICTSLGITPIYGCEIYVNDYTDLKEYMVKTGETLELPEGFESLEKLREKVKEAYHLILLAKNNVGFKNLMKITSDAWINGHYRRPRATHAFIKEHSEGLICGSACIFGALGQCISKGNIENAYKTAKFYKSIFGEDYFIELMLLDMEDQKQANKQLIKIANDLDIKLVVTNDCHYLNKDDSYYQDILLLLQNNNTLADLNNTAKNVFQFSTKDLWYKTAEELTETREKTHDYIPKEVFEKAIKNSVEIAEKCKVNIDTNVKLPIFNKIPAGLSPDKYLEQMAYIGLKEKGFEDKENYLNRIKLELEVIKKKDFASYFLIVKDMIDFAKNSNISVGPGRGSAAGSLLCYCVGITDVDPLQHGLFFERFLNEQRKDIPDIDIDFAPEGRDKIKQYLIDTYGAKHVCFIGTYGSFQTKATVLDVCRVFDIPLHIARLVSKQLLSNVDEMEFDEAQEDEEFKKIFDILKDPSFNRVIRGKEITPLEAISKIRFKQKNMSAHAAGVIISNVDLTENLPLMTKDGTVLSSWIEGKKGSELSTFGFVKWDILGLANLIFIRESLKLINERYGKNISVHDIDKDLNDTEVYEDLRKGHGNMIFQFESDMMRKLLRKSDCDNFDTLAAITALGRPGPLQSGMTEEFCKRKLGKSEYTIHPVIKEVLDYTYGVVVYQEQIMQIVNKLAGYSLAETDTFRKVLIKAKKDQKDEASQKLEKYKEKFIEGGQKYMSAQELEDLFEGFRKWAGYGFNKAHAVAYTVISFRCAWLKIHYPIEYICSVLRNVAKGETIIKGKKRNKYESYIYEAKRFGISTLPPSINKSEANFSIESKKEIRIGFANLKGVGDDAAEEIVKHRPKEGYQSFKHFIELNQQVTKRLVLPLIHIGAFDELLPRTQALLLFHKIRRDKIKVEHDKLLKAEDFVSRTVAKILEKVSNNFTRTLAEANIDMITDEGYLTDEDKDKFFSEEFGFHLLHPFEKMVKEGKINTSEYIKIIEMKDGEEGAGVGIISSVKSTEGKKGIYWNVVVEDGGGYDDSANMRVWDNVYEKHKEILKEGNIVIFKATYNETYSNFSVDYFVDYYKANEKAKVIIATREKLEASKPTTDKTKFLKNVSAASSVPNKQIRHVIGYVSRAEKYAKKYNLDIEDHTGQLQTFIWAEGMDREITKIKIGDFVKLIVKRDDYKERKQFLLMEVKKIEESKIQEKVQEQPKVTRGKLISRKALSK